MRTEEEEESSSNERKEGSSRYTGSRRGNSYEGSRGSEDRFSEREVKVIKKWVGEKDREERKCNIVIKGGDFGKEEVKSKEWIKKWLKEKLEVECRIAECRNSGPVLVAKLGNEEMKKEVMRNKNRLKGGKIFIENDRNWEERKRQEKMNRWAREKRTAGGDVKVGFGRVRVAGVWKAWEEIEREEREKNAGREDGRGVMERMEGEERR